MITIIDYGVGNLGSIYNMFRRIGVKSTITSEKLEIEKAEKILLPGVGSFDVAMDKIHSGGFLDLLNYKALEQRVPVLGICLGMQLLTKRSDEGVSPGLGWINAETKKFNLKDQNLPIPHMGWNSISVNNNSLLTKDFDSEFRYYFVHSYYVKVEEEKNSMLKTQYGINFDSGIVNDNIFGVQFHPEKSHKFGMKLFENFSLI